MTLATARYGASLAHPHDCPLCGIRREANTIALPGLSIDLIARRTWIAGQELALTQREHELLTYFAQRPSEIITKRRLLIDIWGYAAVPRSCRTAETHISRLRRKIASQTGNFTYLPNVRGAGWRLRPEGGC